MRLQAVVPGRVVRRALFAQCRRVVLLQALFRGGVVRQALARRREAAREAAAIPVCAAAKAWVFHKAIRQLLQQRRASAMKIQVLVKAAHVCVVTGGERTNSCT